MGIREPSRVHCLACILFFGNLYPSGKYTNKKPANPQSTKTAHSTSYSMENKVGPSLSRSNPDISQSGRGTPSYTLFYFSVWRNSRLTGGDRHSRSLVEI